MEAHARQETYPQRHPDSVDFLLMTVRYVHKGALQRFWPCGLANATIHRSSQVSNGI